jgi:hypothetical protein
MGFADVTRRQITGVVATFTRASGQVQRADLPRAALLGRLYACVRGGAPVTVTTLTAYANAVGYSGLIRRIRVVGNNSQDIYNMSGPGYAFIFAPYLDAPGTAALLGSQTYTQAASTSSTGIGARSSTAKTAIATGTTVNFDMVIPIALNLRDDVGLFPLANEQTLVTFIVEWEADAVLAAALTWTSDGTQATAVPTLTLYEETFTIPPDPANRPPLDMVHRVIEEPVNISANGVFYYVWPRGSVVLQMLHGVQNTAAIGFGITATNTEPFTRAQLRANQTTYVHDSGPDFLDVQNNLTRLQTRNTGVVPFDYLGTSGLGNYDQLRDAINTRALTDLTSVLTVASTSGNSTIYNIRRELVPA